MSSPDYSQAVADILDGLGDTPTPDEVYHAVKNYSVDNVVAATAATAKAAGGEGGGSPPVTDRGIFDADTGPGINIANNGIDLLDWSATGITNTVADLTDPFRPAMLVSGSHCVTVEVSSFADLTVDGFFTLFLELAVNSDDIIVQQDSRLATAAQGGPVATISNTFYIAAGDIATIKVRNRDGAASRHFGIDSASIQRLN